MIPPTRWTDEDWIAIGTVIGAIGSVAVAVLAIWGEQIRNWIFQPKLVVTIEMKEPDCVPIKTVSQTVTLSAAGQTIQQTTSDAYYFRLRVNNKRRTSARGVELRLTALREKQKDGSFKDDATFQPLSLIWANSRNPLTGGGQVLLPKIDTDVPRHCDLCHVIYGHTPLLMEFDTEISPNPIGGAQPTRRKAGAYEVDVVATADNGPSVRLTLDILYAGAWYAKSSDMFTKGLTIKIK